LTNNATNSAGTTLLCMHIYFYIWICLSVCLVFISFSFRLRDVLCVPNKWQCTQTTLSFAVSFYIPHFKSCYWSVPPRSQKVHLYPEISPGLVIAHQ
jgi:hypothetical protein